jgi:hypothetical protein
MVYYYYRISFWLLVIEISERGRSVNLFCFFVDLFCYLYYIKCVKI